MDIQETRRARLRSWVASNGTPAKEKSYFSQVLSGTAPIGERAARRLERDYGMGVGYLDAPSADTDPARALPPKWPFQLINEKKVRELPRQDLDRLEGAWTVAAAQLGIDVRAQDNVSDKSPGSPELVYQEDVGKDTIQQETQKDDTNMLERASGSSKDRRSRFSK